MKAFNLCSKTLEWEKPETDTVFGCGYENNLSKITRRQEAERVRHIEGTDLVV
jgi:hypothetical protein